MKLCFVNQPWTIAAPPKGSDSTGIWSYQASLYLSKYSDIIYYGSEYASYARKKSRLYLNSDFRIEYRGVSHQLDNLLKVPRKIINKLELNDKTPYFSSIWFHLGYAWQIARDAAQQDCDVIHVHNFSQFVPTIRNYNPKAKIVLHLHCEWVNRLERDEIAARLTQADLIISCSDYITDKIADRFPEQRSICRTIYNGVDADYFVPSYRYLPQNSHVPQILFVGRISPEKGIHDLVDAFIKVTEKHSQAVLTIAGPHIVVAKEFLFDLQPEPEVQALEPFYSLNYLEYIKSKIPAHLASQVIFTGSLSQPELLPHYQNADVVVNPSLSEAFGMSLVEAMATQTPVIATQIGGMPEIVDDGVTGLLVESGNPPVLAEAIAKIISNPDRAKAMGIAGRRKVLQRYHWSKIAESLVDSYADIGVELESNETQKVLTRSLSRANQ